ncbi:MAG: sulfatase-like hydrolase/transferase [Planctomycetota bacterium]
MPNRLYVSPRNLIFAALLLGLSVAKAGVAETGSKAAKAKRPNVVLIMADDMGYEALGCNGGSSYETPILDRIAKRGMRFTHCYSQPVCTPSRVKIMTGRSNARNYVDFGVLKPGEKTFGNVMKEAGYRSAIAGKWQLSGRGNATDPNPGTWMDRCGFDEHCMWAYEHYLSKEDWKTHQATNAPGEKSKVASRFWHPCVLENGKHRPTTADDFGPDIYSDFLLKFIEKNRDDPFFVYYPMALTHSPFVPTPDSREVNPGDKFRSQGKYFGDMVRYTGKIVERFITKIEELGIAENTLILFTCDNGTGRSILSYMGDRPIPGGKAMPIDAGCHVPMLAYWKGTIQPGSVCNDLVDFSDFLPTIAELGNAEVPKDRTLDGRSFLPQLKGEFGNPRDSVLVHYDKSPQAKKPSFRRVRFAYDGQYKLYLDGRLFDVPNDWEEQNSISLSDASSEAMAARKKLQQALERLPQWTPDNSVFGGEPDILMKNRMKQLKELGALD